MAKHKKAKGSKKAKRSSSKRRSTSQKGLWKTLTGGGLPTVVAATAAVVGGALAYNQWIAKPAEASASGMSGARVGVVVLPTLRNSNVDVRKQRYFF